jgi:hypothetical protein
LNLYIEAGINASVGEINAVKNISRQNQKRENKSSKPKLFCNFSLLREEHFMFVCLHLPHFCGNKCINPLCINQIIKPIDPYFGKVRKSRL